MTDEYGTVLLMIFGSIFGAASDDFSVFVHQFFEVSSLDNSVVRMCVCVSSCLILICF